MKKIAVLLMAFLFVQTGFSQKAWTRIASDEAKVVWAITSWSPYSSTDSTSALFTAPISVQDCDSVVFWHKTTSALGAPKIKAGLQVDFYAGDWLLQGTDTMSVIDTTQSKLEALYYMKVSTFHALNGVSRIRVIVKGSEVPGIANRSDAVVNLYAICWKSRKPVLN